MPAPSRDWIIGLPKVELHTHLESVNPNLTLALARRHGLAVPELSEPRGLDSLLLYLDQIGDLVRDEEDLVEVGRQLSERASASGVRYLEVIANLTHWSSNWRHRLVDFFGALDEGFSRAEHAGHARARISVSLLRSQSSDEAEQLARFLIGKRPPRVIALSVDGNETASGMTGSKFERAFNIAAEGGLRRTVHTGESGGPDHVQDSLEHLRVERIDHGFRSAEDPKLLQRLADEGIALNICPSQNLAMGWVNKLEEHPLPKLRAAGVPVTINTDSSWKFGLADEYLRCVEAFGWTDADLLELASASIEASFAPMAEKTALRAELAAYAA